MAPIDRTGSDSVSLPCACQPSALSHGSPEPFWIPSTRSSKLSSSAQKNKRAWPADQVSPIAVLEHAGGDLKRAKFDPPRHAMNHHPQHAHAVLGLTAMGPNGALGPNKHGIEVAERGPIKYSSGTSTASAGSRAPSIASLCNLGNTCFLNSVLYTLRFTPGFLHNLHHLVTDINQFNKIKQLQSNSSLTKTGKSKSSSSLPNGHCAANGAHSQSLAITSNIYDAEEMETVIEVIEQLHDLFKALANADEGADSRDPIPPSSFLNAVGRLNPLFEGNQQQDAHELLVMILTILEDIKIPLAELQLPPTSESLSSSLSANLNSAVSAAEIPECSPSSAACAPPIPEKKSKTKKVGSKFLPNGLGHGGQQPLQQHLPNPNLGSANGPMSNGNSHSMPSVNHTSASAKTSSTTDLDTSGVGRSCSPHPFGQSKGSPNPSTLPVITNFVKENFEGKSVMRTRCLECEASTFRSETFTNIDVPLTFEDEADADELSGKELFLKQIMMSETLRENNKYWCEECSRLNEAQRSVHFELLPKVMVLQLKRFTAATGSKSSYMSKINDHIPTPFTLNCFCTQCMPHTAAGYRPTQASQIHDAKPRHVFKLYAVIMHLGATLASGHYIAYVKTSSESLWEYQQCPRAASTAMFSPSGNGSNLNGSTNGSKNGGSNTAERKKKGIMKFLRKKDDSKSGSSTSLSSQAPDGLQLHSVSNGGGGSGSYGSEPLTIPTPCRSINCCGVRSTLSTNLDSLSLKSASFHHRSIDSTDSDLLSSSSQGGSDPDDLWLECDDESIQAVSRKQFEDILNSRQGATTTPYLLFYQKC